MAPLTCKTQMTPSIERASVIARRLNSDSSVDTGSGAEEIEQRATTATKFENMKISRL